MEEIEIAERISEMEERELIEVFLKLKMEDRDALMLLKEILEDIIQKTYKQSKDFLMSETILWLFLLADKI